MSSDRLREAADVIREDHPPCVCGDMACPTIFYETVALLLENESNAQDSAAHIEYGPARYNDARARLLDAIADAYLAAPS